MKLTYYWFFRNAGIIAAATTLLSCGQSNHRSDDDHESELHDSTTAESTACPWSDTSLPLAPSGILDLTSSSNPTLGVDAAGPHGLLPVAEAKQDMACYKQILKLVYAGEKHFQSIDFTQRIDDAIQNVSAPMSIDAMLSALFKVHEGAIDSHLMLVSLDDPGSSCAIGGSVHSDINCRYFETAVPYRLAVTFKKQSETDFVASDDQNLKIASCPGMAAAQILTSDGQPEYIFVGQAVKTPSTVSCTLVDGTQKTLAAKCSVKTHFCFIHRISRLTAIC
jgi:hypothetical protein